MSLTWGIIAVYGAAFGYYSHRFHRRWLYGSVALWLLLTLIATNGLRGAWTLTVALYHPYFYITLASLPLLVRGHATFSRSPFLHNWLIAALMQHAAFLIMLVLTCLYYPRGTAAFALLSLLQMYFLHPLWWITVQAALMLLLQWGRRYDAPTPTTSSGNIRAVFLSAMTMTTIYVMHDMVRFMHALD